MKKIITLFALLSSFTALANVEHYRNDAGCLVEKETRANGTIIHVTKGNKVEIVGYGKDYSFGSFAYCADSVLEINFIEGRAGTGILLSCNGHQNGHAITRGRVDIDIIGGQLKNISIDGQIKGLLGWKQDTKIDCLDLIKQ